MITLFVRVRIFSFAKSTRERHKIAKKESRKRSLRTEIKKSSTVGKELYVTETANTCGWGNTVKTAIFIATHLKKNVNFGVIKNGSWCGVCVND